MGENRGINPHVNNLGVTVDCYAAGRRTCVRSGRDGGQMLGIDRVRGRSAATRRPAVALVSGLLGGVLVGLAGPLVAPTVASAQVEVGEASRQASRVAVDTRADRDATGRLGVAETEALVRMVYYEGVPRAELARIGRAGCARLVAMLADPRERTHYGRILVALGVCGGPGSFEAIRDWADAPRGDEVDRATYRAWQALPFALAELADRDPRALAWLVELLEGRDAPSWRFRHHSPARLAVQARRAAATCLAMTGLPEARAALDRAAVRATEGEGLAQHLHEASRLYDEAHIARRRAAEERRP